MGNVCVRAAAAAGMQVVAFEKEALRRRALAEEVRSFNCLIRTGVR
eukprot:SAG25_NODE_6_length_29267_cov_21.188803_5_plen_46_part_00